jgi:glycine/serine hydroxymethyltransferase
MGLLYTPGATAMRRICDVDFNIATPSQRQRTSSLTIASENFHSDATSNTIVAMEKRYYCEIIAFLSRRYYRF